MDYMTDNRANGKFKKGVSGNPSGRPKTSKLTQADKNELKRLIRLNDPQVIFEFLIERSNDISDVMRFTREFSSYLWPKLSSSKSEIKEDRHITLTWQGSAGDIMGLKDVTKHPLIEQDVTDTLSDGNNSDNDDYNGDNELNPINEIFGD